MIDYRQLREIEKRPNDDTRPILNKENLFPLNAKIGMVFTSHNGHMPYMKYALQQYREIEDMFIVGAYDSRLVSSLSKDRSGFPYADIWSLAHMWVTKHYTFGGHQKRHGWIWLHLYASAILKQFKNIEYIFSGNGDCVWDKPQGVYEIIDILGDNDFMSGQSETRHTDGHNFIHTCTMVFKRDAYFDFIDFIMEKMPTSTPASYSPENLIQLWAKDKERNVKWEHAPVQAVYTSGAWEGHRDTYCEEGGPSTWRDVLGFRNLEAEKNWRCSNHKEPLDQKYFDLRECRKGVAPYYRDHDKNTLCMYYITGDERYKKMWWDLDPYEVPRDVRIERMKKKLEDY